MAVRIEKGGIHKKLSFLVQHTGGYDVIYHMNQIAKDTDQPFEIVEEMFKISREKKLDKYIEWLYKGYDVVEIFKAIEIDNHKANLESGVLLSSMLGMYEGVTKKLNKKIK